MSVSGISNAFHAPAGHSKSPRPNAASADDPSAKNAAERGNSAQRLSEEDQKRIRELARRDREVRAHEAAHRSAGGPHIRGGVSYTYERGPNGVNYAIGGEVQIDVSPVAGDPEATLTKAQVIHAAALAPAEPSAQDYQVAAAASQMAAKARTELSAARNGEKIAEKTESGSNHQSQHGLNQYRQIAQSDHTTEPSIDLHV